MATHGLSQTIYRMSDLNYPSYVPVIDHKKTVKVSEKQLLKRVYGSIETEEIEPLYVRVASFSEQGIEEFAWKYGNRGKKSQLVQKIRSDLEKYTSHYPKSHNPRVMLHADLLSYLNMHKVRSRFQTEHHQLSLIASKLSSVQQQVLLDSVTDYLPSQKVNVLAKKLRMSQQIPLNPYLLPKFAAKKLETFNIVRGPNCFHSAMAFHSQKLANSIFHNVNREKGYHREMINNDELLMLLNIYFQELDPRDVSLKYGDVMVFLDVKNPLANSIHYKWIKHTSTFLFNGYTFSKGSKSANSPYVIKALPEEWRTWENNTKLLGLKVFRRKVKNVKKMPPKKLNGWLR